MTQQFQVGDIVFVNPLSEDDRLFRSYEGFTSDIDALVGHHAIIESISEIEDTIVRLLPCDADYVFKVEDIPTLVRVVHAATRTSHLTLVRPSMLRTCMITDSRLTSVGIKTIPMAGFMIPEGFTFLDGEYVDTIFDRHFTTILDNALVDEVYLHNDGIGLLFCNTDAYEYDVNEYVTLIIPTQHIGDTQAGTSLFTTF